MAEVWHRNPKILPNLGRRKSLLPNSCLPQVLLHDNVSHQKILNTQLRRLSKEEGRVRRGIETHRSSFLTQQALKHQQLRAMGINHLSLLPDAVAHAHIRIAEKSGSNNKIKDLPMPHRLERRRVMSVLASAGDGTSPSLDLPREDTTGTVAMIMNAKRSQSAFIQTGQQAKSPQLKSKFRREKTISYAGEHQGLPNCAVKDARFRKLQDSLIYLDQPVDGFLRLSPSGLHVLDTYSSRLPALQDPRKRRRTFLQKRVSILVDADKEGPVKPKGIFRPSIAESSFSEFSDLDQLSTTSDQDDTD